MIERKMFVKRRGQSQIIELLAGEESAELIETDCAAEMLGRNAAGRLFAFPLLSLQEELQILDTH